MASPLPLPPLSAAGLSVAVSEHGGRGLDRCYMHFVLWRTGGAGHDEIYQLPPDTTRPGASSPANLRTRRAGSQTLPSAVRGWLAEEGVWFRRKRHSSEKVNWSIDQAVEERGKVPQVGRPVSLAVTVVTY